MKLSAPCRYSISSTEGSNLWSFSSSILACYSRMILSGSVCVCFVSAYYVYLCLHGVCACIASRWSYGCETLV